jgi:hypothetical protein
VTRDPQHVRLLGLAHLSWACRGLFGGSLAVCACVCVWPLCVGSLVWRRRRCAVSVCTGSTGCACVRLAGGGGSRADRACHLPQEHAVTVTHLFSLFLPFTAALYARARARAHNLRYRARVSAQHKHHAVHQSPAGQQASRVPRGPPSRAPAPRCRSRGRGEGERAREEGGTRAERKNAARRDTEKRRRRRGAGGKKALYRESRSIDRER